MRLDALLPNDARVSEAMASLNIAGLAADSRAVKRGYLFAALSSVSDAQHGREFIPSAIEQGAAVILTDKTTAKEKLSVPIIADDNPRALVAKLAAKFFDYHPQNMAAVTGTNGKTSTASFVRQLWAACGHHAASLGTLGIEMSVDTDAAPTFPDWQLTTAEPIQFFATLRDLYAHQITHLVLEASSHGLAQYRLDGAQLQVAGFTNLTHDHLDYHGSFEDYFAAKARLFTEILAPDGTAVVNINSQAGQKIVEAAQQAGRKILRVGTPDSDLYISDVAATPHGSEGKIFYAGKTHEISVPLIGAFQLDNLLVALGIALAFGAEIKTLLAAVAQLKSAAGRMDYVAQTQNDAAVYVDYAHTPDALENILSALRSHTKTKLYLVFGCGGDRDKDKRSAMGAIAARLADEIIITDDNPRSEDAETIRAAIATAALPISPTAQNIGDRATAIATAIEQAQAGDIILIAGKGHERTQIIGEQILPFNDRDTACAFIKNGATQ